MSEIKSTSAQGGDDGGKENRNHDQDLPPPLSRARPKTIQFRGISAPHQLNNKKPVLSSSCYPSFASRAAGASKARRSTSVPSVKPSMFLSFRATTSGWQVADPSLGMMRFTDAAFNALLHKSSVERDPEAKPFNSWGETGAPDPRRFSLVSQPSLHTETDERGVPFCPTCNGKMLISSSKRNDHENGFRCDYCGSDRSCGERRWWCEDCNDDFCLGCYPQPSNDGHDDDDDCWICHLCQHTNASFFGECAECRRRRRQLLEKDANGDGKTEFLSYEEFKQEKDQDEEVIDAQKKFMNESIADAERNLLVEVTTIPKEIMQSSWDPLRLSSFGISSAAEARLCLLYVDNNDGYDLTADDIRTCRVGRGVRLPLVKGDSVMDEDRHEGLVGVVESYTIEGNEGKVQVRFDINNEDDSATTTLENYYEYHGDDDKNIFAFEIKDLVRRSPEEIWLRNDAAAMRDTVNCGEHPNLSVSSPTSSSPHVETLKTIKESSSGSADDDHPVCCICLESRSVLFSGLCRKSENPANVSCDDLFCRDCLQRHCEMSVVDTRYSAGPVRCPGSNCGRRLPMESWHDIVSRVSLLQYIHAPRQLMAIRCPECDLVGGLFPRLSIGLRNRREVYKEILNNFLPKSANPRRVMKKLVEAWHNFAVGRTTPEETIGAIMEAGECSSERDLLNLMFGDMDELYEDDVKDDHGNIDPLAAPPRGLLSLVCDVERRAALALALLRKHPFISLRCCVNPVCFKCKVDGHHEGQTCEERQAEEMDIEAQFCPQCGVPTIRSEGCNHIICVCGAHWRWEGADADY